MVNFAESFCIDWECDEVFCAERLLVFFGVEMQFFMSRMSSGIRFMMITFRRKFNGYIHTTLFVQKKSLIRIDYMDC